MSKIPTIEGRRKELEEMVSCEVERMSDACDGDFYGEPHIPSVREACHKKQYDTLHAIATELKARLERIEAAIREGEEIVCKSIEDDPFAYAMNGGVGEAFKYMQSKLNKENTDDKPSGG
jgi:hypothetical protein